MTEEERYRTAVNAAFADPHPGYGPLLSAKETHLDHPLFKLCGYRRVPYWVWSIHPCVYAIAAACYDIWLVATGRLTLHRAWQAGYDAHTRDESARRARGGA